MKGTLILLSVAVLAGRAQDNSASQITGEARNIEGARAGGFFINGAVMGPTVKGAPYSAMETVENTQTLGDGTHIDRTTQTMVYRDSEGRVRRETPESVAIWDPVAGVSYWLDPKTQTARKMPLGFAVAGPALGAQSGPSSQVMRFEYHAVEGGPATAYPLPPPPLPPPPSGNATFLAARVGADSTAMFVLGKNGKAKTEPLGQQTMEGVNAEGTRETSTIEAGEIGNDRPIQIVTERWYSRDLQTMVKTTHSDPRMGQETLQLTNISRTEPTPDLFQVPVNYQITGGK
jgi:hypothetical protein